MLKNYITLAYRSLIKNKLASAINIAGLAIAVGCSIVAYSFISGELLGEMLHEHADEIFQVQTIRNVDDAREISGFTPEAMGPQLAQDLPQVEHAVRIQEARLSIMHGEHEFHDHVRFVDPAYLTMFTIPLAQGNANILNDPDALVLSQDAAMKYFGDQNPIGQSLTFKVSEEVLTSYTVQAVAERFPIGSVSNFSILTTYTNNISLLNPDTPLSDKENWEKDIWATFVQLSNSSDNKQIEPLLASYVDAKNATITSDNTVQSFRLDNLKNLVYSADEVRNSISSGYPRAAMIVLGTISLFLFTLSCFNYINITLGASNARVKEIGIRKVIGSQKRQIVLQFLTENLVLCSTALLVGIGLAVFLLLPGFGVISGSNMRLELDQRTDFWVFLLTFLVGTALLSGSYPAFFIASFKPVAIFTGKFKSRGPNRFMKTLLTGQFILAFVTMMMCVGFMMNMSYLKNLDWGYDNRDTLVLRLDPESYEIMHDAASQLSQVSHITGARNHLGMWNGDRVTFTSSGQEEEAVRFEVGEGYFDVVRPRILAGTFPTLPSHVLVNENLASRLESDNPIGETILLGEAEYQVAGIAEDFHFTDFSDLIEPAFWKLGNPAEFSYLVTRFQSGSEDEVVSALATVWNASFPDRQGMNYYFQDESFNSFFMEGRGINQIFGFTAILALLLSCAGLFGLASQHTASKLKEMSIRKILGATVMQIAQLGNRQFMILLIIASIIATPISYLLLGNMMDSFIEYRMDLGPAPFIIAIGLTLLVALGTISSQVYRLISVNPAELLKNE
ncbi:MAG: ABC transporter permease [Rhodothermaceae bacterium]|nr:ABC transporter permease [Rhodothermaceae bacterium]